MDRIISPREFLKARRPEEFSDTVTQDTPVIDRSQLEYHLDTITSRSEEMDFEVFALHLTQREVCPNLLPQTGPTGGGDSKVDSETYPVADSLSLIWAIGTGREAASERWAFAFSAKKDWKPKLRSDIKKIVDTKRGYAKAFFVTNQYVSGKKRAAEEDTLTNKYGVEVRVFDRSWILDRVFGGNHQELAITDLRLKTCLRTETVLGPLDFKKEQELKAVEARISSAISEQRFGIQVVSDCIESATLARNLERPRTETDGLFARADRMAEKYGTSHQRLLCAYERAWTAYWWHEDHDAFLVYYDEAEGVGQNSNSALDLELLTNLWFILYSVEAKGGTDSITAKFSEHTAVLTAGLDRVAAETNRPSNALQARTHRLLVSLLFEKAGAADSVFDELSDVIRKSEGLVGYPFEPLAHILIEFAQLFNESESYVKLFDLVVDVASRRKGDVTGARMLITRGAQLLKAEKPYEAIRQIGRALTKLYKDEGRHDLVRALHICSAAYATVGLLWAARGTLVTAASLAIQDFHSHSQITPLQLSCCSRLKWFELELGRVGEAIAWYELDRVLSNALRDYPEKPDWVDYDVEQFDAILAIQILKTELTQLSYLVKAPDALKERGLLISSAAALFVLGYEATLPPELCFEEDADSESFFTRLFAQPASGEISSTLTFGDETVTRMTSHILGCNFTLSCPYTSPCVELGETLLAALESVMATGVVDSIMAREPVVTVGIVESDNTHWWDFSFSDEDGRHHCEIVCGKFDPDSLTIQEQGILKEKVSNLLCHLLSRAFLIGQDLERSLERLFGEDLALDRSLDFTGSFVVTGNVLGKTQKRKISGIGEDNRKYEVRRVRAWKPFLGAAEKGSQENATPLTIAEGPAPADVFDSAKMKHSDVATISLIREVLWNKAGWNGTAFLIVPDNRIPPIMALLFSEKDVARRIFTNLKKELGPVDEQELLRVSIIKGISSSNHNAYRVVIGANPTSALVKEKLAFFVYRLQTMEPSSDDNLKHFLARYEHAGSYGLTYAFKQEQQKGGGPFEIDWDTIVTKRELNIRDAWTIGLYDIDGVGIQCGDTPILPEGAVEVPVKELLARKKEKTKPTSKNRGDGSSKE